MYMCWILFTSWHQPINQMVWQKKEGKGQFFCRSRPVISSFNHLIMPEWNDWIAYAMFLPTCVHFSSAFIAHDWSLHKNGRKVQPKISNTNKLAWPLSSNNSCSVSMFIRIMFDIFLHVNEMVERQQWCAALLFGSWSPEEGGWYNFGWMLSKSSLLAAFSNFTNPSYN